MVRYITIVFTIIYLFLLFAFDNERLPNAVEIEIFGLCIHGHQFRGELCHFHRPCALFLAEVEFQVLPCVWSACLFLSSLTFSSRLTSDLESPWLWEQLNYDCIC